MPPLMHRERRSGRIRQYASGLTATIITTIITLSVAILGIGTAHADAFRYWGFHQSKDGAWAFSQKGPAQVTPKDGDVDGWRYAIAGESTDSRVPRTEVTFDELCADTPKQPDTKQVGVVLDFGLADEAPDGASPPPARGECAVVDTEANSAQVLAEVAEVRDEKGLVCAIDAFPASGCGDQVSEEPDVPNPEPTVELLIGGATPTPTGGANGEADEVHAVSGRPSDGDFPVLPVVGGGILVLLIAGGLWQYNRRRGSSAS